MRKSILFVFGTRPEAIKLCPLVKEFEKFPDRFNVKVCVTGQHREMLDQVLDVFSVVPDYDLNLMKSGQDLAEITGTIVVDVQEVIRKCSPDLVLVQGDTISAFGSALASYYQKIPVGHVEAGLRTGNIYSPWPEEINRRLVGQIASIHFAPTRISYDNLLKEGVTEKRIVITGNTVIDALFWVVDQIQRNPQKKDQLLHKLSISLGGKSALLREIQSGKKRLILITGHRRENFGKGFLSICEAIKKIANRQEETAIIYPVHLNPHVRKPVNQLLSGIANIALIEPLEYELFVLLMNLSTIILTDSGGIQEEAPSLGKPVLVMRDTTERPEAVEAGTVKLVGTDSDLIFRGTSELLKDTKKYEKMSKAHNPYGDGTACKNIVEYLSGNILDKMTKKD